MRFMKNVPIQVMMNPNTTKMAASFRNPSHPIIGDNLLTARRKRIALIGVEAYFQTWCRFQNSFVLANAREITKR